MRVREVSDLFKSKFIEHLKQKNAPLNRELIDKSFIRIISILRRDKGFKDAY